MSPPRFNQARDYARMRLERELPGDCFYHSLAHTRDDVVSAVERLAATEQVRGEALLLLRTAAWYHDLGFVVQPADHEAVSAQLAAEVLPRFGYHAAHVTVIRGMIMATRLPQTPRTPLEQILADADLDSLGRIDFLATSLALRAELAANDMSIPVHDWYRSQQRFLQEHHYFTAAAHQLRDAQKRRNLALLVALLRNAQDDPRSPIR